MVTNLVYLPPLDNSDHVYLTFDFNVTTFNVILIFQVTGINDLAIDSTQVTMTP